MKLQCPSRVWERQNISPRSDRGASQSLSPVGAAKVYPKIRALIKHHHFEIAGPALEIYRPDGTIEYEVPIQPRRSM